MAEIKRKAVLLVNSQMKNLVFGGGRLDRLTELVHLVDGESALVDESIRAEVLRDCEIVISTWGMPKLDTQFLDGAPSLRVVFYAAGSVKGFATQEAFDREIVIQSSWAANAVPVAEFTVAQLILGLKGFFSQVRLSRQERKFVRERVNGCYDKRVGLIGIGMIGRAVIRLLKSYGLEVFVHDPYLTDDDVNSLGVQPIGLDEMFSTCHAVSLHAPSIPQTKHMIRAHHLRSMVSNSCFINTSRGSLIHEEEMVEVLRERPDITVLVDVTDPEPPKPDSPMWDVPNLIISPHIAGSADDECRRMADVVIEELERYIAGEPLKYRVTPEMLPKMA